MILKIITTIINEIIAPSVEGYILITLLFVYGLEKRFNIKYYTLMMMCEIVIITEISYGTNPSKSTLQLLLCSSLVLLAIQLHFKGRIYKKFICFGLFIAILLVAEALTFIIMTLIGINPSIIYTSYLYYAYTVIITVILKLALLKIIVSKIFKTNFNFSKGYLLQVMLLILFALIASFSIGEVFFVIAIEKKYIKITTTIVLFISVIVIPALVIFISTKVIKQTKKQAEHRQLLEQYELEYKYSKELNKVLDSLRILKHDLKNHISCMWGLVETNNIEDFKLYLSNLTEELEGLKEDELVSDMKSVKGIVDE